MGVRTSIDAANLFFSRTRRSFIFVSGTKADCTKSKVFGFAQPVVSGSRPEGASLSEVKLG